MNWSIERKILDFGNGNMAMTRDSKAIVSYINGTNVEVAFADNVDGVSDGSLSFSLGTVIKSTQENIQTSINLIEDVLYLVILYIDNGTLKSELYTDNTGLGTSFAKKSDIHTAMNATTISMDLISNLPIMQKLENGTLFISLPIISKILGAGVPAVRVRISNDGGNTWSHGGAYSPSYNVPEYYSKSGSELILSSTSFFTSAQSWIYQKAIEFTDSGVTPSAYDWGSEWESGVGGFPFNESFFNYGDDYYFRVNDKIYKYTGVLPATGATLSLFTNWTLIHSFEAHSGQTKTVTCNNYIISTAYSDVEMWVIISKFSLSSTRGVMYYKTNNSWKRVIRCR